MKRMTCLLVLAALLLCACTQPQNPSEDSVTPSTQPTAPSTAPTVPQIDSVQSGPVKLINVGTFPHKSGIMFAYGDFVLQYDRSNDQAPYKLLSPLGQAQLTGNFNAASYCGNGIALVSQPGEDYDPVGLVDYRKGQVLSACEALRILQISDRYFLLVYVEKTVTSEEEAFSFYTHKNGGAVYFDGCARILDVETGAFVPDLKLEAMPDEVGVMGDRFYIRNGELVEIYHTDGTVALSLDGGIVKDGVALHPTFGGVNVYGSDLQLVSQLKYASQRLTIVDGGYLSLYDDGSYQLLDLQGNMVVPDAFEDIACVTGDLIVAEKEEGWGVTALNGEEVLPYTYCYIEPYDDFRLLLENRDGNLFLYNLNDATITDAADLHGNGLYVYRETEQGREYLLKYGWETKLFTGDVDELDHGLILTEEGLFELYTGRQILKGYEYDLFAYCDGYVYARIYGVWTVFRVEITE